jgi:predicted lactoylglutathione lyase
MRLFPGLSSLTLGVKSVERASIFYEMLGWKKSAQSSRAIAAFELNNLILFLRPSDTLDAGCIYGQHYGNAEAIEAAMEQAQAAGASIKNVGLEKFGRRGSGGGARGTFADPDGHVWDLVFDPRIIPAPDGSIQLQRKLPR